MRALAYHPHARHPPSRPEDDPMKTKTKFKGGRWNNRSPERD
jgi:hypothetical protein